MEFVWNKPVLTFYKNKSPPEREAFAAVKARKLAISKSEGGTLNGSIQDFFPLMGNVDCISSKEKSDDRYIICWFDDTEEDLSKAGRRLTGVTFTLEAACAVDGKGRKTYNANFNAEHGKLT
jgi:hypothetical protein